MQENGGSKMIQRFVDTYMEKKEELRCIFSKELPRKYEDLVRTVVSILGDSGSPKNPDPHRIHKIDYGEYTGTLVFVIAESGDNPRTHWYAVISYGSFSGCDTLQRIINDDEGRRVEDMMTLALHIVQAIKEMI